MRAVLQRVSRAKVSVDDEILGAIENGFVILLGVGEGDTEAESALLAEKVVNLRVFNDADMKFNLSALDIQAQFLIISQFTLYADVHKGRRPSFIKAAHPDIAAPLVQHFMQQIAGYNLHVEGGRFGAHMMVDLVNDGPVTIMLDTNIWTGKGQD